MKKQESRIIPEETHPKFYAQELKPYEFIKEDVRGKRILEVGCGDGYGSAYLAKVAREVFAIDYEESSILKAKLKYIAPNLKFVCMDAINLEFEDNFFDVVCSYQVIEHIPENQLLQYLSEIKRVLKKNGKFYLSTLNLDHNRKSPLTYKKNPAHCQEFRLEELKDLLSKVFINCQMYGLYLTLKHHFYLWLKRIGILNLLPDLLNPVIRFYN